MDTVVRLQRLFISTTVYDIVPDRLIIYPAEYKTFDKYDVDDYQFRNVSVKFGNLTIPLLPLARVELTWNKQRDPITNRYTATDQDALLIIAPLYLSRKHLRDILKQHTGKGTIKLIAQGDTQDSTSVEHTLAEATFTRYNQLIELQDHVYLPEICFTGHWLEQRKLLR